jgi:uncharacterized lipoprotein
MKKVFPSLLALCMLAACGSDNTTKSESDTGTSTTGPGTPAVENVNGNVPDTSSTIRLNRPLPTDSITTDSVRGPAANGNR